MQTPTAIQFFIDLFTLKLTLLNPLQMGLANIAILYSLSSKN
jgi:hypothetical protein